MRTAWMSAVRSMVVLSAAAVAPGVALGGPSPAGWRYSLEDLSPVVDGDGLRFEAAPGGSLVPGGPFRLGTFAIAPPESGEVRIEGREFLLQFKLADLQRMEAIEPAESDPPGTPTEFVFRRASLVLPATIDGVVSATGAADLTITFGDPRPEYLGILPAVAHSVLDVLPFRPEDLDLPRTIRLTSGSAELSATVVPEPATLALFLAAGAGLGWLRSRRR